jgi:hypothetical protein
MIDDDDDDDDGGNDNDNSNPPYAFITSTEQNFNCTSLKYTVFMCVAEFVSRIIVCVGIVCINLCSLMQHYTDRPLPDTK